MTAEETPATRALTETGIAFDVVKTRRATSAEESASFQNIALSELVKTIVVRKAPESYVFVLVPADREIDWPKLRRHLGVSRASIPPRDEAERVAGYAVGAITPFGAATSWPVVLDASAAEHDRIALGGGAHGVNVHLAPNDLVATLAADVADVTSPR